MKFFIKILRKVQYLSYDLLGYVNKVQFLAYGKNVKFFGKCYIKNHQNIVIGENVTFNDGAYLNGLGGIEIGDNVSISAMCIIVSTGLNPLTLKNTKEHINEKIKIGNNVQIGTGAIVLSGVKVGDNVLIGAGSVVTKDIASNSVVAGNPARIIREI
jgi:maltose O-acetyltransferase